MPSFPIYSFLFCFVYECIIFNLWRGLSHIVLSSHSILFCICMRSYYIRNSREQLGCLMHITHTICSFNNALNYSYRWWAYAHERSHARNHSEDTHFSSLLCIGSQLIFVLLLFCFWFPYFIFIFMHECVRNVIGRRSIICSE